MRKTDKKIENQLRLGLTDVCEQALKDIEGFQWLTHAVDYANFPNSLKVTCVFNTNESLKLFLSNNKQRDELESLILKNIKVLNVEIKKISKHVKYDIDANC